MRNGNKIWLLTFVALVLCQVAHGEVRRFFGRIINRAGMGIQGEVGTRDGHYRFHTNAEGVFDFTADADSMPRVIFAAMGYDAKEFAVEDLYEDSIIVELKKHEHVLDDFSLAAKGKKLHMATSGISSGWHNASCYFNIYDEIAVYLPADDAPNGLIHEVGAYITHDGVPGNDFKIHIFKPDSATHGPGEEITDSDLVVHGRHGGEWVTADLTKKLVQVHGGVYVSVEWIVGSGNNYFPVDIPKGYANYYSGEDSLRTVCNGQVLGLAWQQGQPRVYRRYASERDGAGTPGPWHLTLPHKGGHKGQDWMVPMVYYTYSYVDR